MFAIGPGFTAKASKSRRVVNEELDLAEPEAFGQQLACDHLIVFKSSRGKEHAVLIVQDRFSKVLQAYPTISREASQLASTQEPENEPDLDRVSLLRLIESMPKP